MLNDNISIKKLKGGEVFENQKALVQNNSIIFFNTDIIIEPNDLILRKNSNGGIQAFEVIDPNFIEGFGDDIPSHYNMEVKKLGIPPKEDKKETTNITNNHYNLSDNSKVNNNSVDNSTININDGNKVALELIEKLKNEINDLSLSNEDKSECKEIIDTIEYQCKEATPNKVIVKHLLKGLPITSNISSIGSFILAALQ